MNQSKGLKYGDVETNAGSSQGRNTEVVKLPRKRNTRKQSRPIESEAVGQPGEDTSEALPEGGEGDALVETDSDI